MGKKYSQKQKRALGHRGQKSMEREKEYKTNTTRDNIGLTERVRVRYKHTWASKVRERKEEKGTDRKKERNTTQKKK